MAEPVGGLRGGDAVEGGGDGPIEILAHACRRPAQRGLQLGERQLDRVVVRGVRREEQEPTAACLDEPPHGGALVDRQVVEDQSLARCEGRQQQLADRRDEGGAVRRERRDQGDVVPPQLWGTRP